MKTARERRCKTGRHGTGKEKRLEERENSDIWSDIFSAVFRSACSGLSGTGIQEAKAKEPVQIVTFGDSVFGMVRDETAFPARLGKSWEKRCIMQLSEAPWRRERIGSTG